VPASQTFEVIFQENLRATAAFPSTLRQPATALAHLLVVEIPLPRADCSLHDSFFLATSRLPFSKQ
jgi:hypothetical protein